jgi:cytochrome c-type biogenesis protein CcmH
VIWIALAALAAVALAPLAIGLRREARARGRRDADIALHRAELEELDRDAADGRIAPADHATATLEVQRRLLAAADAADAPVRDTRRWKLLAAMAAVPVAAFALYLLNGEPDMPDAPLAERREAAAHDAAIIDQLRAKLATMDPKSEQTRQGYMILGNAEEARGDFADAATAFRTALKIRFEPVLAARAAESLARSEGKVTPESADLFRQALAAAPADAPWRRFAEDRIKEAQP